MKPLFRMMATLALAGIFGISVVGCDLGENGDHYTEPTQQPGQAPGYQEPGQPGGIGSELPITDAELEKAAVAYVEIAKIEQKLQDAVQQHAQDSDQRQALQTAANKRMAEAIENAGLEVETYTAIMDQVQSNQELGVKCTEEVQQELQKLP